MGWSIVFVGLLWPWIPPVIDLDGDTDRDKVVSNTPAEEALEDTRTVLVINNCDRDDPSKPVGTPHPDNQDDVINGCADRLDLEPLFIRRLTKPPAKALSLRLKALSNDGIKEKERVRIFKDDGTMILGPSTSTTYVLTDDDVRRLRHDDMKILVEGLAFATSVKLSLYLGETEQDSLTLEVAPFLLVPQSQRAVKNYVVNLKRFCSLESARYVDRFRRDSAAAGVGTTVMFEDYDPWIEDEMSWGYSQTPRVTMPVALHLYRLQLLKDDVRALLGPDVGYATAFDYGPDPPPDKPPDPLNFGGNIEVTPPTCDYPFGRVYYGSLPSTGTSSHGRMDPRYKAFFERQGRQPPIDLNTDWLYAGHVDELITFLPKRGGGFALFLASPARAIAILRSPAGTTAIDMKYQYLYPGVDTPRKLLDIGTLGMKLQKYNEDIDSKIFGLDHANPEPDSIKGRLKAALQLKESDIFEIPVLYVQYSDSVFSSPALAASAVTPNLVNLNSIDPYCILPDPSLDAFRSDVERKLQSIGQTPLWIDDWEVYHLLDGDVHCGSNTLREPFTKKWWLAKVAPPHP